MLFLNVNNLGVNWLCKFHLAVPEKKKQGGLGHNFLKPPGMFRFFTLLLEVSDKTMFQPYKFYKIMLHPLEILRPQSKTPGNST